MYHVIFVLMCSMCETVVRLEILFFSTCDECFRDAGHDVFDPCNCRNCDFETDDPLIRICDASRRGSVKHMGAQSPLFSRGSKNMIHPRESNTAT